MNYSSEFNEWTEAAIQECVLQKQILFKLVVLLSIKEVCMIKIFEKIPVKKLNFSKVAEL